MTDDRAAGPATGTGDGVDPGEPVTELAGLSERPSPRFLPNVMDGIHRRQMLTQAIEVSWWGITSMLLEFVQTVLQALGVRGDKNRER